MGLYKFLSCFCLVCIWMGLCSEGGWGGEPRRIRARGEHEQMERGDGQYVF